MLTSRNMDWACCALFVPSEKQKELLILGSDTKHRICLINAFDKRQLSNNMVMQLKSNLIWKFKGNITGNYEFNTGVLMETLSKIVVPLIHTALSFGCSHSMKQRRYQHENLKWNRKISKKIWCCLHKILCCFVELRKNGSLRKVITYLNRQRQNELINVTCTKQPKMW